MRSRCFLRMPMLALCCFAGLAGAALASEDGHAGPFAQPPMPRFAAAGVGPALGQDLLARLGERPAAAALGPAAAAAAAAGALPWGGARRGVPGFGGATAPLFPGAGAAGLSGLPSLPAYSQAVGQPHHSHHHSGSAAATLANAAKLAKIASRMYPPSHSSAGASYSDCARPHAPRAGFQSDAAAQIAAELALPSARDVTFFDLNAPLTKQFCHAAVALVPAASLSRAGISAPNPSRPVFIAAFRGSSNAAAAIADIDFESATHTVRGSSVAVHAGFWESLFGRPSPQTCDAAGSGPVPKSCAEAVAAHIDKLAAKAGAKGPVQVLVTGHSLGAAEAALFALHLDAASGYDVAAYTYGQPKIGRGRAWRAVYDGPNGLSQRTYRVVHGADPVPMLASRCQTRGKGEDYEQVGTLLRVRTAKCPVDPASPQSPKGMCLPAVTGSAPVCTIEPEDPTYDDCSIFVGQNPNKAGVYDVCFCKALPVRLTGIKQHDALWGDHQNKLYVSGLAACQAHGGLAQSAPGALPPKSVCSKVYNLADVCSFQ